MPAELTRQHDISRAARPGAVRSPDGRAAPPASLRTQALLALAALSSLLGVAALFALHAGLGAVLAEWRRCGSSLALIALGALAAGPLLAACLDERDGDEG